MLVGWVKDRRVDLPAHSLSRMFTVLAVELAAYGTRKTLKGLRRLEWKATEQKRAMLEQSGLERNRGSPGPVCQVDSVYEWSENQRRLASCIQETCSDQFALRHADRFRLKIFKALRDVYSTLLLHTATSVFLLISIVHARRGLRDLDFQVVSERAIFFVTCLFGQLPVLKLNEAVCEVKIAVVVANNEDSLTLRFQLRQQFEIKDVLEVWILIGGPLVKQKDGSIFEIRRQKRETLALSL